MAQDWSFPLRVSGDRKLAEIPLEIYHEIFSHLKPGASKTLTARKKRMADLRRLSFVCHLFRDIIAPIIFETLFIVPNLDDEELKRARNSTYYALSKSLQHGVPDPLLPLTKTCMFRGWYDWLNVIESKAAKAFLNVRGDALLVMNSLTALVLTRTTITVQLLGNIRDMTQLQSLAVEYCDFSEVTASTLKKYVLHFRSKLSKFKLIGTAQTACSLDISQKIEAFFPLFVDLLELITDTEIILHALLYSSKLTLPIVEHLDVYVDVNSLRDFFPFLYRTPRLKSLVLDSSLIWDPFFDGHSLSLFQHDPLILSRLENLRQLTVPPFMISKICADSHRLSHLSFLTRESPSSHLNYTDLLFQAISASNSWHTLANYTSLFEMHLPLTFALFICMQANQSGEAVVLDNLEKFTVDFTVPVNDDPVPFAIGEVLTTVFEILSPQSLKELFLVNLTGMPTVHDFVKECMALLMNQTYLPELEFMSLENREGMVYGGRKSSVDGKWGIVDAKDC